MYDHQYPHILSDDTPNLRLTDADAVYNCISAARACGIGLKRPSAPLKQTLLEEGDSCLWEGKWRLWTPL